MIEAAFTFGVVIFAGIALILWKLPTVTMLKLLNHAMAVDIVVTLLALAIHWGTMTGLMAAAICGLMCSIATSGARWAFGYIRKKRYYPGYFRLKV